VRVLHGPLAAYIHVCDMVRLMTHISVSVSFTCWVKLLKARGVQQGLAQYGNGFLAKFEAASCANKLLEEVTLVDTPGVLSGEKQRIERTYNFIDVCGWFAARCDLILLLFDPHKLDISDEFKQVIKLPAGSKDPTVVGCAKAAVVMCFSC